MQTTLRTTRCLSCLFLILASAGCCEDGSKAKPDGARFYLPDGADVRLALTPKPDHPWMMTLTIANTADRDVRVFLWQDQIAANLVVSQGERHVRLNTRAEWSRIMIRGLWVPGERAIAPGDKLEHTFDLLDYLDAPQGNDVRHLTGFDFEKPVNVQMIMANPDPADGVRRSNSVPVNLSLTPRRVGF